MSYAKNLSNHYNTQKTPQTEVIPGREEHMAKNNAGGVTFTVDDWARLERFLILGTEGGTYYVDERQLTIQNAKAVQRAINEDGLRAVQTLVEISDSGRAAKNDPALFALALAASAKDAATRQAALAALPKVARIGTHLFHFAEYVKGFRGYGRALRNAMANWYLTMPVDKLALQAVKYQQRDGWTHRDILRLAHPKTLDPNRDEIFRWIVKGSEVTPNHDMIRAFEEVKSVDQVGDVIRLITDYNLPREAIPTQWLNEVKVWEALLNAGRDGMPMTAMVRNLGKMTNVGLLTSMSDAAKVVAEKLGNADAISKARIHPMAVLNALRVYSQGGGYRGKLTWSPVQSVVDALDSAFYLAFGNVEPTGKNILIGVDCSGSMSAHISGSEVLSCRDASAAMALVTANVESNYEIMGFSSGAGFTTSKANRNSWYGSSGVKELGISPNMRLDTVIDKMRRFDWGSTDCSLSFEYAIAQNKAVDGFVVLTDNETYAGTRQPVQALKDYRQKSGRAAKSVVVSMTANNFTIADPLDAGMLDCVGFDTQAPSIISDFFKN